MLPVVPRGLSGLPAAAARGVAGEPRPVRSGVVVAHNDAAPYNAVWRDGKLVGFIDWDMAGPRWREDDLAWTAFSWVLLHARHVVAAEGFTDFAGAVPGSAPSSTATAHCSPSMR
jgi:aminoglycoside phosphotransferase (APT) family kinase protein